MARRADEERGFRHSKTVLVTKLAVTEAMRLESCRDRTGSNWSDFTTAHIDSISCAAARSIWNVSRDGRDLARVARLAVPVRMRLAKGEAR